MILDSAGNPHTVSGVITVEKDKTLTLKSGCVLLFNQFSGLNVDGNIVVEGSKDKPVVFTSINDEKYNDSAHTPPQPFDWNGISVSNNAKQAKFGNFILCYSTYGIKIQNGCISIDNGVFHSNGQFSCTINGKIQPVTENFPFSYKSISTSDTLPKSKPSFHWIAPAATGLVGLAAIAGAVYFFIDKSKLHDQYSVETDIAKISSLKQKEKTEGTVAAVLTASGAILVPTSVGLFVYQYHKDRKAVISLCPLLRNEGAGALVLIAF
jgi:hypothetical protein